MSDKEKTGLQGHMDVKDANPDELLALMRRSTWFTYLQVVPVWERQRIAEAIMGIDLKDLEGVKRLNQLLLAEVAAGNVPAEFLKNIDPLLKNLFAAVAIEDARKQEAAGGSVRETIQRVMLERRTITQVEPTYAGPAGVIDMERVRVG